MTGKTVKFASIQIQNDLSKIFFVTHIMSRNARHIYQLHVHKTAFVESTKFNPIMYNCRLYLLQLSFSAIPLHCFVPGMRAQFARTW